MEVGLPCGLRHVDGPQLGPSLVSALGFRLAAACTGPASRGCFQAAPPNCVPALADAAAAVPPLRAAAPALLRCRPGCVLPSAACHLCCPMLSTCRSAHDVECVAALPAGGGQVRGAFFHAVHARQADQPAAGGERELQAAHTAVGLC